jgi:hypothetical protein
MRSTGVDLLVVGSGALSRSVCYSFALCARKPTTVMVLARDRRAAEEVAQIASTRAVVGERSARFVGRAADLADPAQLEDVLGTARPRIVLQCASWQSPWEGRTAPSRWSELIGRVGLGITLPLQARLAMATGQAMRAVGSDALLVNGCFPDAVNPLLTRLDLPVFCGIGNIATLAAGIRTALGGPDGRLRMLAHHAHLHAPDSPEAEARAWLDGRPVPDVSGLLVGQRSRDRAELNHITGYVSARLIADLLADRDVCTNLPGPLGLPGGYPTRIEGGLLELDLPAGLTRADAVAFNERAAGMDGIRIGRTHVWPTAEAASRLGQDAPELIDGFAIEDTTAAAERLCATRHRLRAPHA